MRKEYKPGAATILEEVDRLGKEAESKPVSRRGSRRITMAEQFAVWAKKDILSDRAKAQLEKYSEEEVSVLRRLIRIQYIKGEGVYDLEKKVGLDASIIQSWRKEELAKGYDWDRKREIYSNATIDDAVTKATAIRVSELSNVIGKSLELICMSLGQLEDEVLLNGRRLDLRECKMLSEILGNLHKVESVETGRPTGEVAINLNVGDIGERAAELMKRIQTVDLPGLSAEVGIEEESVN